MKTLSNSKFKGKRVLVRSDLDSDVVKGKVFFSERVREASETIKELKRKKARVVILAHQGRPGKSDFTSLRQHSRYLNKFVKVKFVPDISGKKAVEAIGKLKDGEAILLENVRKSKDEFNPGNNKLVKTLAPLFDIYVNDSFSTSHRKHTSIVSFAKRLPTYAGRALEKEIKALKKIKLKNCLYILAGAKPEDNIKLLSGNKVLSCGLFGQICLIAKGKDLGAQNKYLKDKLFIVPRLKKRLGNVETPIDFAVEVKKKRKELKLDEFPSKYEIYDIGKGTMDKYVKIIEKARCIYMKGPAGFCADKRFCKGTETLLRAIAKNKGFSLLGGGHLSDAIKMSGISRKKFGHVSLSGGALLSYIAGEKLPGLEVLR